MKNITVTVHDEVYTQARVWAAMNGTTISALVKDFIDSLMTAADDLPTLPAAAVRMRSGTPPPPPHLL